METQEFRAQLQQSILRSDIVRIFDNLLTIAVEEGASDIHIEPMKRLPQDARVSSITQTNKEIDLRANTLPTVW